MRLTCEISNAFHTTIGRYTYKIYVSPIFQNGGHNDKSSYRKNIYFALSEKHTSESSRKNYKQSLHLLLRYKKPPILPQILDNGVPDSSEAFNNMKPDSAIDRLHALKFDLNTILSGWKKK